MSTAPAGLTKNLRLQGKFLLFFGLVSLVFVTIFHFVSYLGSRNIVENVVYDRIENDLRAIKVLLNTSLNASVSNILVYEAEVLQAGLNETENLQEYFWTMEATQKRLKARGIDLIALEDLGQRTFPFTPRFSSLWLERDYEGNFYIQEVITRSEGVNDTRIQTLSHREIVNGQHRIHIHTFFYVPALDKVILLSALRSDFVHSLALEDIREAVVGFQFGERGSIELFTKENIQLIHSARQFESTIRDTDLHDKVIRMRSGITREEIPLSDLNSKVYVSSSAADSLQSENHTHLLQLRLDTGCGLVHRPRGRRIGNPPTGEQPHGGQSLSSGAVLPHSFHPHLPEYRHHFYQAFDPAGSSRATFSGERF
jgi:hypothetical protein